MKDNKNINKNFEEVKKIPISKLLITVIMLIIVVLGGSFAWFTYQSRKTALVLNIGELNNSRVVIKPYQINDTMVPVNVYTSGVDSQISVFNENAVATEIVFFYKINQLDATLINNGLKYTIVSSSTIDGNYVEVKTGDFTNLGDEDKIDIFDAEVLANTTTYYKVYLWLDNNAGDQSLIQNLSIDIELNATIILPEFTVSYEANLLANVNEGTSKGLTISYDKDTSYLTLNGTPTSNVKISTFGDYSFIEGEQYKLQFSYVSGSFSSSGNYAAVLDIRKDMNDTSLSERNYVNSHFPVSGIDSALLTVSDVSQVEGKTFNFWIWPNSSGLTFNNYVVKVVITKVENEAITYGAKYVFPNVPAREGYTFGGWYTAESGGTQVTSDTIMNREGDHTLYAQWTTNKYTITYNANGGSGSMTATSCTYGSSCVLKSNSFQKTNYNFTGWNTKADGSGTSYSNSYVFNNFNLTNNITLYAQWELAGQNLVTHISNLYTNGTKTSVTRNSVTYNYVTSQLLMNDRLGSTSTGINGGNIRYYGANPKNYIYFNCLDYSNQSSSTCETWRIIGVFNGKVKIMRSSSIGSFAFDTKVNNVGYTAKYSEATLMQLLNPGYEEGASDYGFEGSLYWNAKSGKCYSGANGANKDCSFTTTGLKTSVTRNLISQTVWIMGRGGGAYFADVAYTYEEANKYGDWNGWVGLPAISDYAYAVDLSLCTRNSDTYATYSECSSNNWMYNILNAANTWFFTAYNSLTGQVMYKEKSGNLERNFSDTSYNVIPSVYLDPDAMIGLSNTGSSTDPYRLVVSNASYADEVPECSIVSTEGSTTLTANYSDDDGVVGYYFGTTRPTSSTTFTSISSSLSGSKTGVVGSTGTYYFGFKDIEGNIGICGGNSTATSDGCSWGFPMNGACYENIVQNGQYVGVQYVHDYDIKVCDANQTKLSDSYCWS